MSFPRRACPHAGGDGNPERPAARQKVFFKGQEPFLDDPVKPDHDEMKKLNSNLDAFAMRGKAFFSDKKKGLT
jgi:hypothetical protein